MKAQVKNLRTYTVWPTTHFGKCSLQWPPVTWRSNRRIREFCIIVFRKYFGGRNPSFHWHKDGFMAEANDKRGNSVTVEQTNWWHQFAPGTTLAHRPLAPMIVGGAK